MKVSSKILIIGLALSSALAGCAEPTPFPTPSATPEPPPTETPTLTPTFAPIGLDSAADLASQSLKVQGVPLRMAWSGEGRWLAVMTDQSIWLIDSLDLLADPRHLDGAPSEGTAMVFSSDGVTLAAGGQGVQVWNADTGEGKTLSDLAVSSMAFTVDGAELAIADPDGWLTFLHPDSGDMIDRLDVDQILRAMDFSPDGAMLATSGNDGRIWLWDVAERRSLSAYPGAGKVNRLIFSPDGTLIASASEDGVVRVWFALSGRDMAQLQGHNGAALDVAFHPTELILASAGEEGQIILWDIATGQQIAALAGSTGTEARAAVWSPDGVWLAGAFSDGTISLWHVK